MQIGHHRVQLVIGNGAVVVIEHHPNQTAPTSPHTKTRPNTSKEITHALMVRVADVDRHYEEVVAHDAKILRPLATYPYGQREYSVEDLGGHCWSFSQTVDDVAPEKWGGTLITP